MDISKYIILLLVCSFHIQNSYGKFKILAIMPFNGKSHFFVSDVLFEALAQRGNDVTVLSHFPKKTPVKNYHDISMSMEDDAGIHKINMEHVTSTFPFFTLKEMFNTDCFLGFVHKFQASLIFIRTSTLPIWLSERTGNPENPSYIPGTTSGNPSRMSFLQRLDNIIYYINYKLLYWFYNKRCEAVAREHFGDDMPNLLDIARNASFYLINSYFVHQYPKPLLPNTKEIAGMHVKEPKKLPQDLENWISGATHGLIYFNLGSMLRISTMAEDKRLAFLESFAQLPHRVLMKWEEKENTADIPDNVKLTTWSPQNDVLHHPNVKLFITHGGMLGTVEAVHAGVPMIAIPFYGDQLTNVVLLEERGLGIALRYKDISFETINRTLHKVLYDPGYARRAKDMSAAFRDRPISPLDEAIHWVEYVARHKGTAAESLLQSPAHELAFYQYLLLDVLAVLLLGLLIIFFSVCLVGRFLTRVMAVRCRGTSEKKTK
ncbi:PREDICTED: UDP-glucuronosyltransferase 2B13-like isoform X2 [Ceratosolen solmsi marchali]|uniref:UDP-glucuronosyltransferase n=1 Tax=Ceratosolen solmsi marchali TaxID=326594 RepID=A0AAJ6YLG1_9HYME|nr:PREDICTED: UDP-glucuronosyltransferase 2B13-like isoform X2 [Ceratosolen solmsi marchali]